MNSQGKKNKIAHCKHSNYSIIVVNKSYHKTVNLSKIFDLCLILSKFYSVGNLVSKWKYCKLP